MKNYKKIALILLIIGIVFATAFFIRSNNKALVPFETTKMIKATIENKIVYRILAPMKKSFLTNILLLVFLNLIRICKS